MACYSCPILTDISCFDVFKINVWGYHSDVEYGTVQLGIQVRTFRKSVIPPPTGCAEGQYTILSQEITGEVEEVTTTIFKRLSDV